MKLFHTLEQLNRKISKHTKFSLNRKFFEPFNKTRNKKSNKNKKESKRSETMNKEEKEKRKAIQSHKSLELSLCIVQK